jgi:transposase, IS5 family
MQDWQTELFDLQIQRSRHSQFKDPLIKLNELIEWKTFLPILEKGQKQKKKGFAGRKPYDLVLMFKILILKTYYNLSDDQTEYQIHDRYSFRKFLELSAGEKIPDAKTIWHFSNNLAKHGLVEELFDQFEKQLAAYGYQAQGGQIVDASIIPVPRQRNTRTENKEIKEGKVPEAWKEQPHKLAQKDTDARWTKKNEETFYGYKNHIDTDVKHGMVRSYEVTDAAVHDSEVLDKVLDPSNTNRDVYADSAYRSKQKEADLKEAGYRSKVHHRGYRNNPLSEFKQTVNRNRSKIRAKVEHVFGRQHMMMGGKLMRCIGIVRAKAQIGLRNLVHNMSRLVFLETKRASA